MPVHFIRVIRELSDNRSRQESENSFFYTDVDRMCTGRWEPNTDITESEDEVFILVELAGVKREDITVKVKNGKLLIKGLRRYILPDKNVYFHQLEINCGEFLKTIPIPQSIEHNEISAQFYEGLLEIRISKTDKPVEIPVSSEWHKENSHEKERH